MRLYGLGGTDGNRTSDTRIFSPLLYQLSYGTSVLTPLSLSICAAKLQLFSFVATKIHQNEHFFCHRNYFILKIRLLHN